ncbi:HNH endonuclease [Achromobacter denitrificans]|uniref:HNH endonuclease n=1 Tax=Achromobacter TaxID=222 RepID=UPI0023E761D5|nr:HNH endonuclease [Achromobacter denitrificans]MDF3858123.1 HNH endonuclease [Achromobacter denitrificans]
MNRLTADEARALLAYDPATGALVWRKAVSRNVKAGGKAGSMDPRGYGQIRLHRRQYMAHRLVWLLHYGEWPKGEIDHIDGNRANNRICNLREVDRSINTQNLRRAKKNSRSGVLGVSRSGTRWQAHIQANNQQFYLGTFSTPELAHAAYLTAKRALHPGCTI